MAEGVKRKILLAQFLTAEHELVEININPIKIGVRLDGGNKKAGHDYRLEVFKQNKLILDFVLAECDLLERIQYSRRWEINEESSLKSIEDIQRAHDILVSINAGEAKNPFPPEEKNSIISATDAICWVLNHTHNVSFQNNLDAIVKLNGEPKQYPE